MQKRFLLIVVISLFVVCAANAQVHINEYSASNLTSFYDNFAKTEDWIELYNTSDAPVDISGWHLSDKESKPEKWKIPNGTVIPANGFLVFLCSGRDGFIRDQYHTNFKLAQTTGKDIVLLSNANGNVIEQFPLDLTLVEHSHCRTTDGSNEWKICTAPTYGISNNNSPQVLAYTQTPSMSLEAGFYTGSQTVSITNHEPNSVIRYTLDGTNPTVNSPEYTEPLTLDTTQVVKAQAFSNDSDILPGKMEFNTYLIDEDFSLAVYSVAADDVIELAGGQGELIPIGSIEYFNTKKERQAKSFGSLNRHGQDSWILPHRSLDWISRDEMGYSKALYAPLFSYSERDEYQRFMFRNSGDDNYPAIDDEAHEGSTHIRDEFVQSLSLEGGMNLDQRAVERVVLFLNGQYWGVYGMREKAVDHDFTGEYYDQGKYEIQYLSTWATTEVEYGGLKALEDWENLRDFILENDMGVSENYQIADDSIKLLSLIDYFVINQNVVASDWLNYNTGWWRGLNPDGDHKKWGYILWDLDATFDYYINYTGIPNTDADALPCDLNEISIAMDEFFSGDFGGGPGDPADCSSIIDGSSPYPATDEFFIRTIQADPFCCNEWDENCQATYDNLANGGGNGIEDPENCPTILNGSSPYPATDTLFVQTIEEDAYCCETDWDETCQAIYDNLANGGGSGIEDPENCPTILNGSSPYPATDTLFIQTIEQDGFCCENDWDEVCQSIYDSLANGGTGEIAPEDCPSILNGSSPYGADDPIFLQVIDFFPTCCSGEWGTECQDAYDFLSGGGPGEVDTTGLSGITGNVGSHEKLFLKLLEESDDFKQLYYSRYADLMNTVFSCENMNTLLERMIATIKPEMPRQIERWGGTMEEWETNLDDLRAFINQRCEFLDDAAMNCYSELSGTHNITLLTEPDGIGEIDFNTLDIEEFPWTGDYFGGMENKIKAKVFDEFDVDYEFSHWVSTSNNLITPSVNDRKAHISLSQTDSLIAVFRLKEPTNIPDLTAKYSLNLFPNPSSDYLILDYELAEQKNIRVELYSSIGVKIMDFVEAGGQQTAGRHSVRLSLPHKQIAAGLYLLQVSLGDEIITKKVSVVR